MEGQSMLNLYDGSSGNFLDEVANPGGGAMMPPDGAHNMGLGGDAMMQGGMDQGMNPGMQQDMMMMAQQPAVQQNYTSLHNPMQHTQKLHHYNSYGATDQFAGGGATVGMPGQELMSSPHPSQQPFGSPPPGGSQLQSPPQQNFTQYTLQSSPRLTPPRQPTPQPQQMSISQNSMTWRASPGPAQQNMPPGSPYSHNGLSQQPNSSGPTYQMPTYLTHHDYALPPSMAPAGSQQRLALYQDSQAAMTNQPGSYSPAPPPMGSPAPTQRLTHMNVQTPNVISNQRPVVSGAGSYAQNNPNELLQSPENVQSNYEAVTQVQQGLQPTQMNSGSQVNTQRLQDFTYHQSSPNPAAAEAPPLSHYSQSNQSLQLNQSYMTSGQQNLQPSLTTQTSTTGLISVGAASQGNFQTFTKHNLSTNKTQTSVLSSTGGFQTDGGQMANSMSNANIAANQQSLTIPVGQQFRVVSGNTCGLSNATLIVNSSMAGLSSGVGAPMATSNAGQLQQPIVLQTNQQNVSLQIQQLQQQIQQLYNMQQNPQTQQKMLDLQEQVRSLAAQQQLQQQQRQKQQFFQQRPQPATIRLQQPSGLQGQVVTAIRLQPNKVAQQTRMQLPQQSLDASQQKQHHVVPVQHQTPQKHQLQTVQVQPKQVVQLQQAQVVQVQPKQQTQLLQLQQAKQQTQVVQLQQQVQATPQQSPKTVQARQVVQVQATPQQGQKSAPQTVRIVQANIQQKIQQPQQIKQISILSTPPTLPVTVSKAEQRPPVSTHVLVSLPQLVSSTASQHQQSQSQSLPQLQPSVSVQQARSQALPQLQPNVSVQQARSQPLPQLQPSVSVQQSQPQLKTSQPQLVTLRTLQPAKPGQTQQSQQIQQIIIIQQPNQQQQQVRIANAQVQGDQIQTLAPVASAATVVTTTTAADSSSRKEKRKGKGAHLQDKANKIIAEAIAKAEAEGREVPKVLPGASPADGSVEGDADEKPKKKKKKPKEKKPKEVKEKKPRPVVRPKSIKKKKVIPTFLKKRKRKDSADSAEGEVPGGSSVLDDDLIQKRRSSRNTKRKKYLDELDLDLSEDENKEVDIEGVTEAMVGKPGQFFVENPKEEDALIVEKVLGMRTGKRTRLKQVTPSKIEPDEDKQIDVEEDEGAAEEEASKMLKQKPEDTVVEEVEEFYVKYKNFSYLHCDWKTLPELELGDKRVQMKIRRFKQKRPTHFLFSQADDEDYFNADYIEVDRVLDESTGEDPVSGEVITYYLVKWQCLPYEDSTWEVAQDVDTMKIEAFERFKEPPPEDEREMIARPSSKEWTKIEESPIYKMGNKLREYQLEGVSWLTFCYYNKQNCILADEMGLGKTIQSIAFLHEVYDYGIHGPFLVIAPLSTIPNWQREFESWTDMNVVVYHGTTPSRNMIAEYEMYYKDDTGMRIPDVCKYTVLITTYEIIISDCEHLSQIEWRVAVIDEAHRLKNRNCKLLEGLKLFDLEHRVLLTGTPLQNNVEELFSLLNFLEPRQFSSSESFMTEFGDLKSETQVDKLKAILKPMMLRRLKEDVEKSLAPKEETIIEVELTNIQKKYYRAILEKNFQFLAKGGTTTNVPNLMNTMMELRKCCNHPYLITGAEEKILEETRCAHGNDPIKMFMAMVQSSGKLVLIDKLLPKLKAGQHKVLVFSQMIRVLDIIEDYLIHNHYLYERLDGRIRGNLRQEAIDRFSRPDSDRFVFLLCTRAGGLGINLTAADTVIIYDSDWNPQNDLQAQARCHRIGQSKAVKVYRLITRNSYEREMFDKASMKLGLDKAVLQSMGSKEVNPTNQLSKREIEDLLKKGAYGAIMDDNKDGDQFCEEDIDQILKRRTQVIQIEAGEKGSTFAKASFSVSGNRSDINIDDPNFWQKWAKKAELDMDDLSRNELVIEEPRQRKQTARYGNQDSILDMSELETSGSDEDFDDGALPLGRKGKKGRKGRRGRRRREEEDVGEQEDGPFDVYLRSDCFKVEKHLLVYGWGRWLDILRHGRFKRRLLETDVETISRAMLMFSLRHYAGDERIKEFICDLINPSEDGRAQKFKNHSGLAAPVPRGRKGRKAQKEKETSHVAETLANFGLDPDTVLRDEGYKKHLKRHANKVLLRVRLLYYLRQEVIGNQASKVFSGAPINEIDIPPPTADGDVPMYWWDSEADRSLLIGVFKHGYEKYNMVRGDPCLCFLSRCGPPDGSAMLAEQNDDEDIKDDDDDADIKPKKRKRKNLDDDDDELSPGSPQCDPPPAVPPTQQIIAENGKLPFPAPSDLNTRLRRVITGYQRSHKKRQQKQEQRAKKMEKRERFEAVIREREKMKKDAQQRWSRREETDFYRVVSTFGVEREPHTRKYRWDTFRSIARLERKYDDTLLEYFNAFYHMCKRVGRKITNESEMQPPNNLQVELITEERANRCLARIDLLCKIREEILWDPKLEERLKLCQSSLDMPEWWIPGVHDKDLLIGAAKHGLARTDYHILYDPKLAFREIVNAQASQAYPPNIPGAFPLMTGESTVGEESIGKNPFKEDDEASQDSLTSSKIESASEPAKDFPDSVKTENENSGEEIKSEEKVDDKQTDRDLAEAKDNMELPKPESPVKGSPVKESNQSAAVEESPVKMESPAKTEPKEELDTEDDTDEFGMSTPSRKPSFFQNMDLVNQSTPQEGNYMDDEGNYGLPPEFLGRSWTNPLVEWPKDRVVFTRLEHVCHCIQTGEWPIQRRYVKEGPGSRSDTPQGTPNMKQGTPMGAYDHAYVGNPDGSADGLKLTFQKKKRRKHKGEFDAVAELREMSYISQSDAESESNLSNFQDGEGGDFSPQAPGLLDRKEGDPPEKKRRGRKKKLDKLLEEAMAAQIRKQQMVFAALEPDARIPVVNIEDGSRLSGEEAPMKKDLPQWLEEHPGYMVERQEADDDIGEPDEQKKGRRKRVNPATLDLEKLTGDENVAVINRETGKRIAGAKAPPIKLLRQWLEKNPAFDVDAKWAHVVKAKANLPEEMQSRVLVPSGRRGRRPANYSSLATDYLNSAAQLNAYAGLNSLYAAYPKLPMGMTAFGGLGGLGGMGLANPMYAASLASMGYFSGLTKPNQQDSEERAESQGSDKEESSTPSKEKESAGEASSSSVATTSSVSASLPHPSFAYMYNPMMYSQLYAQSLAAANFTLPPSVPTSFASLAQSHNRTQNGMPADSDDAEENIDDRKESVAQDLSVKKIESGDDKSGFSTKTKSSSDNVEAEAIEAEAMDLSVPSRTKTELEEETLERSDSPDLADVMDSDDDDLSDEES